jgi:raffinose/stachyose/melibiose transport system substrate-binding protein
MEWYNSSEVQKDFAAAAYYIPITKGSADAMTNPFKVQVAKDINGAHWHALFFDQALGPAVGGVVNDVSAELADNQISAKDAADQIKQAVDDGK